MKLTDAEVRALISAGREIEAGDMDEHHWPEDKQGALASALDKLTAERERRKASDGTRCARCGHGRGSHDWRLHSCKTCWAQVTRGVRDQASACNRFVHPPELQP